MDPGGYEGALPRDAAYLRLPRPDYEPHPYGVRPGAAGALAVAGGLLLIAAPFGAWLRVTEVTFAGSDAAVVGERLGYDLPGGLLLAVAGAAALVLGPRWRSASRPVHLAACVLAAVTALGTGALLLVVQADVLDATAAAVRDAAFFDRNAGAGWGVWAAVAGSCALLLAALLAVLARTERPGAAPVVAGDGSG